MGFQDGNASGISIDVARAGSKPRKDILPKALPSLGRLSPILNRRGENPAAGAYTLRFKVSGSRKSVFSHRYGKMLDNFMGRLQR